jgi:hypothetical protein
MGHRYNWRDGDEATLRGLGWGWMWLKRVGDDEVEETNNKN